MTITSVVLVEYKTLNTVFVHVTQSTNPVSIGRKIYANAINPDHSMYDTMYAHWLRASDTTIDDMDVEVLATFSDKQEAQEYRNESIAYFNDQGYVVINTNHPALR